MSDIVYCYWFKQKLIQIYWQKKLEEVLKEVKENFKDILEN